MPKSIITTIYWRITFGPGTPCFFLCHCLGPDICWHNIRVSWAAKLYCSHFQNWHGRDPILVSIEGGSCSTPTPCPAEFSPVLVVTPHLCWSLKMDGFESKNVTLQQMSSLEYGLMASPVLLLLISQWQHGHPDTLPPDPPRPLDLQTQSRPSSDHVHTSSILQPSICLPKEKKSQKVIESGHLGVLLRSPRG